MNAITKLLIPVFFFAATTPVFSYDAWDTVDEDAWDEVGGGSSRNSQHYTDLTQEILRQVRNAKNERAQTYYVKENDNNVYAYSSARSAAVRLESEDVREEVKIVRKFKAGQKVKLIPLRCGIGVIKRRKQPSPLFVVMRHFESENDRQQRIADSSILPSDDLEMGMAVVKSEVAMLFTYITDCEKAEKFAAIGDDEFKQWTDYVLSKRNGVLIDKGEKVMIIDMDGIYVKVLYNNDEWWLNGTFLKMK